MIFGDQTVVEVVILDLQEDGLAVNVLPWLQEVDYFGGDKDAVAINGLHSDEAGERKTQRPFSMMNDQQATGGLAQ